MKSSQVLGGLFEDPGRQILLIRPGYVIFDGVHVVFWLSLLSQVFEDRYFRKFKISFPEFLDPASLICPVKPKPNRRMTKTKRITAAALMACLSGLENRQSEYGEQNTDQRTRDGEPERNVPAKVMNHASSISAPTVFCCLH
jgi:hypothetical protein